MKIDIDCSKDWMIGIYGYLANEYDKLSTENSDQILCVGLNNFSHLLSPQKKEYIKSFTNKYLHEVYTTTFISNKDLRPNFDLYDKIYSICGYCVDAFKKDGYNISYVPHPVTNPFIDKFDPSNKIYDTCFMGSINHNILAQTVSFITNHNYLFLDSGFPKHPVCSYRTHLAVSPQEKMSLIHQSKTMICYNWVYNIKPHIIQNYLSNSQNFNHNFIESISKYQICPQIKPRVWEAATCGSVILCRRDPWNVIEDFFEPDKEFIYFDDLNDLNNKIKTINKEWDKYSEIAFNAYEKVRKLYKVSDLVNYIENDTDAYWECKTQVNDFELNLT